EQFELPANEWVNVPLNNIPYVETFYAMVHWTTGGMGSNGVGIDKNGEYAEAGIDWSYNGTPDSWKHIVEVVPTESGTVMIRANANIESGTVVKSVMYSQNNMRRSNSSFVGEEISAEHPAAMNVPASIDVNALYAVHSAKATPAPAPVGYNVYRLIEGQDEADWTQLTELAADITSHTDTEWASLEDGGYQYAVKAEYANNKWSRAALSNIVGKNMEVAFTVNITANAPDATVTGAIVTLINNDNPVYTYTQTAEDAAVVFVDVWKGVYSISVTKEGFEPYFADNITIGDTGQSHAAHLLEITMTPFNLTVDVMETDAMLYWNNPSKNFFDDMEQHAVFTNENIGNYILHDGDGALTYELDIITGGKYDFPHSGEAGSFIVFDPNQTTPPNGNPAIAAHSGNQFIGSFAEAVESDDWLILPKHFVVEGSILKFYAKSLSGQFIERFKVGVSTTLASPEQFTFISEGDYVNVPDTWTEYTYDLSMYAGQEVFVSIVCVSNNAWLFMVDDIFLGVPDKNGSNAKSFSGYTIYLDDEQVATGIMDTEYKFTNLADGEHTAGVKAVYTSGGTPAESIIFTIESSGINGNSIANVTVYGNRNNVHIVNPAGVFLKSVQITDIIGRVVYSGKASGSAIIPVNSSNGIYAVKLIDNDGKVAVTKVYLSK
ncbi:MAG: choice-of-anchor J domain-containing protein, partial [Cytophagaceae bacterium]|nr:choice-of-anchor J domain-containing protein [Cytophagaceae bacterium]